jgi:hypothetical protein
MRVVLFPLLEAAPDTAIVVGYALYDVGFN